MESGRPFRSYAHPAGHTNRIHVGSEEYELPSVLFLLSFNHALHSPVVEDHTGILHAVSRYYKECPGRSVLLSGILVHIAYMTDRSSDCIEQRCAASDIIRIAVQLFHFFYRYSVMDHLRNVIKEDC